MLLKLGRNIQHLYCFTFKNLDLTIIDVLGFDDVINIMLAFLTNKAPFFSYLSNIWIFLTQIRKNYAIVVICAKNETICETGSINILI